MTPLWTLFLAFPSWGADDPAGEPDAEAPAAADPDGVSDDDDETKAPRVSVKVWTRKGPASTSVGQVRTAIEDRLEQLERCWAAPTPGPVELKFVLKTDGRIEKVKVTTSSLDPSVDGCVADLVEPLEADTTPDFQEKLAARITGPPRP